MKTILKIAFAVFTALLTTLINYSVTNAATPPTINPTTVDESTFTITITFHDLIPGAQYYLCPISDDCDTFHEYRAFPVTPDGTSITVDNLCGSENRNFKRGDNCGDNDYFQVGTYKYHLYGADGSKVATANVDVQNFVPVIDLSPRTGITPSTQLTVTINGTRRPHNEPNRNNYQIDVEGENGSSKPNGIEQCFPVTPTTPVSYMIGPFNVGDYRIEVTEQVDEDSFCKDNTVYYKMNLHTVRNDGGEITGEETLGEDGTSVTGPPGRNPCEDGTCPTALGNISTDIASFSTQFLSIAIGIAGGIALVLMVIGSIRVLMSSGDPKGIGAGRDMIIAAVAGLLFLIFSVLILKFIGLNILGGII